MTAADLLIPAVILICFGIAVLRVLWVSRTTGQIGPVFRYCPACGMEVERRDMATSFDPMTGQITSMRLWVQCPGYTPYSEHYYRRTD